MTTPPSTVFITGAGAGIGQALAVALARQGMRVVATSRSAAGLARTAEMAQAAAAPLAGVHALDVTDAQAFEQHMRQTVTELGAVDLLLNNAAVHPRQPLQDSTGDDWAAAVATNLTGVANGCRAALRCWPANRPALILNVGSFAHLGPLPGHTAYCASKAGVAALTRALAVELTAQGSAIVVNEWVPGQYRTAMGTPEGDAPERAVERLLAVWQASRQGPGGRVFIEEREFMTQSGGWRARLKRRLGL